MPDSVVKQALDKISTRKGLDPRRFNDAASQGEVPEPTAGDYLPDIANWPEPEEKQHVATGLCAPSIHVEPDKEMTATEAWIAGLIKKREEAIASGQFFDGEERDNVASFDKKKNENDDPWDYMPSDYNG